MPRNGTAGSYGSSIFIFLHGRYENSPLYSMQVKKQQLELDMEKQTGSKLVKECVKAVYCNPAYLT